MAISLQGPAESAEFAAVTSISRKQLAVSACLQPYLRVLHKLQCALRHTMHLLIGHVCLLMLLALLLALTYLLG